MTLPRPDKYSRLLVLGKTGQGKSHFVKSELRQWVRDGARVVVLDPAGEYGKDRAVGGPMRQTVTASQLADEPYLLKREKLALAVVPDEKYSSESAAQAFLLLSALVVKCAPVVLVVEEVGFWAHGKGGRKAFAAASKLDALATLAGKDGVSIVVVAQRAAMVPAATRSQASQIVSFAQDEAEDITVLLRRTRDEKFAMSVTTLRPREWVTWRAGAGAASVAGAA